MKFTKALAAVAAFSSIAVSALPSVVRQGRYLYQSGGARFFVKGIAYQQQGSVTSATPTGFPEPTDYVDPLADAAGCTRDLPYLQQLGVNAIRVYSVNSALNHDSCMKALSAAGIYVILDLALPVNGSIDRISPAWTTNLLDLYTGTIDAFLGYDNILAFNIGNEVVTQVSDTISAPFIKAAARDVKAYLAAKSSTALVGFASTDGDSSWRLTLAEYLACDTAATSIDLYGLNVYRWCGNANISAYSTLISDYTNYSIPAYFSEFGCVTSPPRLFTEVAALFGPQMTPEWSGGMAFSYFPAVGGYGMVNISSDGLTVTTGDDFARLKAQYAQVTFSTTPVQSAAGADTQATCPTESATFLASNVLPPTPIDNAQCACLKNNALTCVYSNTASNNSATIIGTLLDYACATIPTLGSGGTCTPIGANGTTGTYGAFSECDPVTKLSYALTQYYELSNRATGSCDFAGNATTVTSSTAPANSAAAEAAISSCAAAAFTGTTVPAQPSSTTPSNQGAPTSTSGSGSTTSGSTQKSGAVGFADTRGALSVMFTGVLGLVGGTLIVL